MARIGAVALLLLASAVLAAAGSSSTTSQCTTQRPGANSTRCVAAKLQGSAVIAEGALSLTNTLHWCAAGLALTLYRYKPELFPQSGGFNVSSPFNVRRLSCESAAA
jgi:hypothetical protein